MKPLIYWSPDYYLGPGQPKDYNEAMKREARKRCILTKHSPKYIKTIFLDLKNGPLRSKLKRTKIIQELKDPYAFSKRPYWRTILANKMKTLKTISNHNGSPHSFAQKLMTLTGLKSLSVSLPVQRSHIRPMDKTLERYFKVVIKRINRLKSLKSLSIQGLSKYNKELLEKLNSLSRLLSSLTIFQIKCDEQKTNDPELLHIIQSQKNIINSMTSLDLESLCSPSHFESFKNLADSCPKLQRLSFGFSNRNVAYSMFGDPQFDETTFPFEINYLAALKTFHNLKSLDLSIADAYTCLKDLALPISIEHLTLDFKQCLSKEILLKIDPAFCPENNSQFFQDNQTLLQFYDKFRCLDRLETLNIRFNTDSDAESYQYQNYLLHSLLKRVPTLRKFTSGLSVRCPGLNKTSLADIRDPDLPQLFDSCRPFSQTLQTLEIGHEKIFYSGFDLSASHAQFPQLSSIKINGQFEEYKALNPPILPLLEQLVSLGDSLIKIKLLFQMDNTVKSVISLLQQMSQLKIPAKLNIEMAIRFLSNKDLEDLKEGFEDAISELGSPENRSLKAKRISLKMHTTEKSEGMNKFLSVYGERFEHFEVLSKNYIFS